MRTMTLVLASTAVALMLPSQVPAESYAPKVGQRHPDFTLPRIDDRAPVSLSDFRGKKVLFIQFASW